MRSSWVLSSILAGVVYACGSETTSTFDGDDASNDSQIPLVDGATATAKFRNTDWYGMTEKNGTAAR